MSDTSNLPQATPEATPGADAVNKSGALNMSARLRDMLSDHSVAVCRVNHGKVKLDALLPEGHTRAWQCRDVPLICQRLHVDLLDTGYPVG